MVIIIAYFAYKVSPYGYHIGGVTRRIEPNFISKDDSLLNEDYLV